MSDNLYLVIHRYLRAQEDLQNLERDFQAAQSEKLSGPMYTDPIVGKTNRQEHYDRVERKRAEVDQQYAFIRSLQPSLNQALAEAKQQPISANLQEELDLVKTADRYETGYLYQRIAQFPCRSSEEFLKVIDYFTSIKSTQEAIQKAKQGWNQLKASPILDKLLDLYDASGLSKDAILLIRKELETSPGDSRLRKRLANFLIKTGSNQEAFAILREEQRNDRSDLALRQQLALLYNSAGQQKEAFELMIEAIHDHHSWKESAPTWIKLLNTNPAKNQTISIFRDCLKTYTDDVSSRIELADLLKEIKETCALIHVLIDGLAKYDSDVRLMQRISFSGKVTEVEKALKEYPNDKELTLQLSKYYASNDKLNQALFLLFKGLHKHSNDPQVKARIDALLLGNLGVEKAIEILLDLNYPGDILEHHKYLDDLILSNDKKPYVCDLLVRTKSGKVQLGIIQFFHRTGTIEDVSLLARRYKALKQQNELSTAMEDGVETKTIYQSFLDLLSHLNNRPRKWWEKILGLRRWSP